MIIMRPIDEPLVLESLDTQRFGEDVRGYVIMDNEVYLGHALYCIEGTLAKVCECTVKTNALVDGAVRACVAAADNAGATHFTVNTSEENLNKWLLVFFKGDKKPQENKNLLENCN